MHYLHRDVTSVFEITRVKHSGHSTVAQVPDHSIAIDERARKLRNVFVEHCGKEIRRRSVEETEVLIALSEKSFEISPPNGVAVAQFFNEAGPLIRWCVQQRVD